MESLDASIPDERDSLLINPVRTCISQKIINPVHGAIGHNSSYDMITTRPNSSKKIISLKPTPGTPQLKKKEIKKIEYRFSLNSELKIQLNILKQFKDLIKDESFRLKKKHSDFIDNKTLLIDLDETLIYTCILPPKGISIDACVKLNGKLENFLVVKRPCLDLFLSMLYKHYDLMVNS